MARILNFRREFGVVLSNALSVEKRQQIAAAQATRILNNALAANKDATGRDSPYRQFVDGRENAPLDSVNPDHGLIAFQFDLIKPLLAWIGEQLVLHSPWGDPPIHYAQNHIMLADGVEVIPETEDIPAANEYFFINLVPYARKIERGESSQAPDGVYDVVADMAQRRFGNIAKVGFTYRSLMGPYVPLGGRSGGKKASAALRAANKAEHDSRNPAIYVLPR